MSGFGKLRSWSRYVALAMFALLFGMGGVCTYAANSQTTGVTLSAAGGNGRIDLSWAVIGKIRSIQVMRDTDANPNGRQRVAILRGSARAYTDKAVANGRQYWYWIKYVDTAGRVGNSNAGSAIAAPEPEAVNYTLTIGVSGNGTTSVSAGSHRYKAGSAVTITATPASGSVFSGWSGAFTGNSNPLTLTINGNQSLTAIFSVPVPVVDAQAFVHPGLLHNAADFERMRAQVALGASPWKEGWERLTRNGHSALTWKPNPQAVVYRGLDGQHAENYGVLYNDMAAAYALALRWKVSGDDAYAERAVAILDAWSATLTELGGNGDKYLSAGIYGYQFANAAEIMRDYQKWPAANLKRFQDMMVTVFYPMNHYFLTTHNGSRVDHHFANWDLANMASMIAIGVLADRRDIYDEAVEYFKHGGGNGAIEHVIWKIYPEEGLGQTQEAGRDQGHNTLIAPLLSAFCQMAWNQNDDLFGYDDNRVLKGMEYIAKYNLGHEVPYTPFVSQSFNEPVIAEAGRGTSRPGWELIYNHYVVRKGLTAPYVQKFAEKVRPEGGGGDYGPNSGGYDQIGYGTLTATLSQ
jgi:hypothetical protein